MRIFPLIKEIRSADKKVLHFKRWLLFKTPWFEVYLHLIKKEDLDKHLHDHPWNFASFVIWGGYVEETPESVNNRKIFSIVKRKATDRHKILRLLYPTTFTIVFAGPRIREWGYLTEKHGWVTNETYRDLKRKNQL